MVSINVINYVEYGFEQFINVESKIFFERFQQIL